MVITSRRHVDRRNVMSVINWFDKVKRWLTVVGRARSTFDRRRWAVCRAKLSRYAWLSVHMSLRVPRSGTACPNFIKSSARVTFGRGLILFWQPRDTLCTSGFVNDVVSAWNSRGEKVVYSGDSLGQHRTGCGVRCLGLPRLLIDQSV